MSAATQAQPVPDDVPKFPPYMAHLVDRAASLLRVHGLGQVVCFNWWADGEEVAFTARLDWPALATDKVARVVVFRGRCGSYVCRSLPGDWFTLDPEVWVSDVAKDEQAGFAYETGPGRKRP